MIGQGSATRHGPTPRFDSHMSDGPDSGMKCYGGNSDEECTAALAGGMSPGAICSLVAVASVAGARENSSSLAPERVVPCRVIEELLRLAHTTIA